MEIHHFESTLGVILKASEHVCRLIIMFKLVASLDISAYKKKNIFTLRLIPEILDF